MQRRLYSVQCTSYYYKYYKATLSNNLAKIFRIALQQLKTAFSLDNMSQELKINLLLSRKSPRELRLIRRISLRLDSLANETLGLELYSLHHKTSQRFLEPFFNKHFVISIPCLVTYFSTIGVIIFILPVFTHSSCFLTINVPVL